MLCNVSCFCCRLLIFSKLTFSKNSFSNTISVSNLLDPDQDRHCVGPDLGPNCLQRLSADEKSPLARKVLKEAFCAYVISNEILYAVLLLFFRPNVYFNPLQGFFYVSEVGTGAS